MTSHRDRIIDQFTRQAMPFSTAPGIRDEEALRQLVELAGAGPDDTALDVACGPGLVVCALAGVARHATGIDVTPAMIERARTLAAEKGVANVSWQIGEVLPLPYPDASFSLVIIDNVIDHTHAPAAILQEISRVLADSGYLYLTVNAHTRWGALVHELLAALHIDKRHPYTFTNPGLRQFLAAIGETHPDLVDEGLERRVGQRTIPRVVNQRSPFRPSGG